MPRTACSRARTSGRSSTPGRRAARALAALLLGCGAAAACAPAPGADAPGAVADPAPAATTTDRATARDRADAALDTLLSRYWRADAGYFTRDDSPGSSPTPYWTSAQALDSVLDGAERNGPQRYAEVVASFYARFDAEGWTSGWFDDEAWMGLTMLRAYDVVGERRYLERAVFLAEDIAANAQDGSCCGVAPGGLWWDRDHTQKATAANAGAAVLAARLAERTGEARWLDLAKATYGWWLANMVDPVTGQVADHVEPSGNKVTWRFTYNEGTMIGAAVALHRVTGDPRYLADARRMAGFMLSSETRTTPVGQVLFDGGSCSGDCEQFKGIGHRFLSELLAEDPSVPGVQALLAADAEAVWTLARAPDTGTFSVDWAGPAATHATVEAMSSAAAALAREAARLR
jgi:predicted alpha-1,6-mannanase (GH76 family)